MYSVQRLLFVSTVFMDKFPAGSLNWFQFAGLCTVTVSLME